MMHVTEVGKLFLPGRTSWPESVYLEYTPSGPMLIMAVHNPTAKEAQAAKTGKMEFALYETDLVLWFLYKIHGFGPWSDVPFSIRVYDGKGMSLDWSDGIEEGMGLALQIYLIDAGTGILHSQRLVGLGTKFSREFRAMILRQLERPFSQEAYDEAVHQTYRRLSSDDLLARADIKCRI